MKSSTIRLIIILAILTAAGIIVTQTFWVRSAYNLREKEFNINANVALRTAVEDIMRIKELQMPKYSPVTQESPDYYIAQTNVFVEKALLQHYLATAFTGQNILTDFEFGLYDCSGDTVQYQGYYHMPGSNEKETKHLVFPHMKKENYYFGVYFPHRKQYLASQLSFWTLSTFMLVCVLGFLGYLLIIIFRQKRLAEVQKDFVNNMTHEFKTPLATIQISADVLKNPTIIDNPQRLMNYATIISDEAAHLASQVERVLQMAHADKGKLELKKVSFVWQDILNQVAKKFEDVVKNSGGTITLHLPDAPQEFYGDVLHLKNMVGNLIDNAIKYCDKTPDIHIFLKNESGRLSISVEDNGAGIDQQHQKMLFEKFYRVPTGNLHNVKGFGLGLNYVRLIAKAHGCEVDCNSQSGKGSIFTITCPVKH